MDNVEQTYFYVNDIPHGTYSYNLCFVIIIIIIKLVSNTLLYNFFSNLKYLVTK